MFDEKTDDRGQKTEDRRQKTEDRRQKIEDRVMKTKYFIICHTTKEACQPACIDIFMASKIIMSLKVAWIHNKSF
jgi:hypothetical protein